MADLTATDVLDREFLTIRSQLLDLAAALDRVGRGLGDLADDSRWTQIQQVMEVIAGLQGNRAERSQLLFSFPYIEDWRRQFGLS